MEFKIAPKSSEPTELTYSAPVRTLRPLSDRALLERAREKSGIPVIIRGVEKDYQGNDFHGIELAYDPKSPQELIDLEQKFWTEFDKLEADSKKKA